MAMMKKWYLKGASRAMQVIAHFLLMYKEDDEIKEDLLFWNILL